MQKKIRQNISKQKQSGINIKNKKIKTDDKKEIYMKYGTIYGKNIV